MLDTTEQLDARAQRLTGQAHQLVEHTTSLDERAGRLLELAAALEVRAGRLERLAASLDDRTEALVLLAGRGVDLVERQVGISLTLEQLTRAILQEVRELNDKIPPSSGGGIVPLPDHP